jgi:hypothetical protein
MWAETLIPDPADVFASVSPILFKNIRSCSGPISNQGPIEFEFAPGAYAARFNRGFSHIRIEWVTCIEDGRLDNQRR